MTRKPKKLTTQKAIRASIQEATFNRKPMRIGDKATKALKQFINKEGLDPSQITKAACNFAKHAKRRTITEKDVALLKTLI